MSEATRAALRIALPAFGSSVATNFAPDPTLPGPLGYIPGAGFVERMGGFAGAGMGALGALSDYGLGTNLGSHGPAFLENMGDRAHNIEEQLYGQLGGVEPEGEGEKLLKAGVSGAGAFAPMVPVGLAGAAPAGVGALLRMLPTFAHAGRNMSISAGIGAGAQGLHDAVDALRDQGQNSEQTTVPEQPATEQRQGPLSFKDQLLQTLPPAEGPNTVVVKPGQPAQSFRDQLLSTLPPAVGQTPDPTAQGSAQPFSEVGDSRYTVMHAVITLAAAVAGAAAGRTLAQMGTRISETARDLRSADPAYAQKVADYENARASVLGDQISNPDQVQAPLPTANVIQTIMTKASNWGLDATRNITQVINLTARDPGSAQKLAHQAGEVYDQQMWDIRHNQFLRTGHEPESGITVPSPYRWMVDAENLPPDKYRLFNDASHAASELNNRDIMAQRAIDRGETPDPSIERHDFANQDRAALETKVRDARADPIINDLLDRQKAIMKGEAAIAEFHQYITAADNTARQRWHPDFLPQANAEGRIIEALDPRALSNSGGILQVNTKATSLVMQHLDAVLRDVHMNNFRRNFDNHIQEWQDNSPGAPTIAYDSVSVHPGVPSIPGVYPAIGNVATTMREQVIPIRTSTGTKFRRYDEPMLYDMLSGNNLTKARAYFDSMGKFKQILQLGTTGVGSILTGRYVPFRTALYTAIMAPINAPRGYYGGPLSYLTGGKAPKFLTAPLDIPLNVVGAGGAYLANWGARTALMASDVFHPQNQNKFTQALVAMRGEPAMQMLSDKMMELYKNSVYYEGQTLGLGGQSMVHRVGMPLFSRDSVARTIRSAASRLDNRITINADSGAHIPAFVYDLKRGVQEAFIHAGEATHDFLYRLNRDNPNFDPQTRASLTRQIVGDPSVSGAGRAAQAVRSTIPYANVAIQGTRALGKEFSARPFDTTMAMVTSFGTLAAISMLTAFQSQTNLFHYTNDLSTSDRASKLVIYNGVDGERSAVVITMPQEMQWIWAPIQEGMFHAINMIGAAHDKTTRTDVLQMVKDFLHTPIDNATIQAELHGLNAAFNPLDFPPVVKAGAALTGGSARIDLAKIIQDTASGNLGMHTFASGPPNQQSLPNESLLDMSARNADGKTRQELLSSFFGLFAGTIAHAFDIERYHAQGNSWLDAVGYAGKDWMQDVKDYNPGSNTLLFENQIRLSRQPPIVEMGQRAVAEMRKTQGGLGSDEAKMGLTGGKFPLPVPTYPNSQGKVPQDPTMRSMYQLTAGMLKYLDATTLPQIGQIRQQMDAVQSQMQDPKVRREWMNNRTRDLADKWRTVDVSVRDLNSQLSSIAGKPIDIRKGINWQSDLTQFD